MPPVRGNVLAPTQRPVLASYRSTFQTPERLSDRVMAFPEAERVGLVASIFTASSTVVDSSPVWVFLAW